MTSVFYDQTTLASLLNETIFASASGFGRAERSLTSRAAAFLRSRSSCRPLARDALNLDGGSSDAMWIGGCYVVGPGRQLPNAILLLKP